MNIKPVKSDRLLESAQAKHACNTPEALGLRAGACESDDEQAIQLTQPPRGLVSRVYCILELYESLMNNITVSG